MGKTWGWKRQVDSPKQEVGPLQKRPRIVSPLWDESEEWYKDRMAQMRHIADMLEMENVE